MELKVHFRRCHICGEISQISGQVVGRCTSCQKPMAPFFYFDELSSSIHEDHLPRPEMRAGEILPIRGLTAFWDLDTQ